MKRPFSIANAALRTAAFTTLAALCCNCTRYGNETPRPAAQKHTVKVTASTPDANSRAYFAPNSGNSYSLLWNDDEVFKIAEFVDDVLNENNCDIETSDFTTVDGHSGSFQFELTPPLFDEDSFSYFAVYPYVSAGDFYKDRSVAFTLPSAQIQPNGTSADSEAVLMFADGGTFDTQAETLDLHFHHVAAFGHILIRNLAVGSGEKVETVSFTAEGKSIAGLFNYHWDDRTYEIEQRSDAVTVDVSSAAEDNGGSFDVWFAALPEEDIRNFEICISTTSDNRQRTYRKSIAASAANALTFKAGHISMFGIDMQGITADGDGSGGGDSGPEIPDNSASFTIDSGGRIIISGKTMQDVEASYEQEEGSAGVLQQRQSGNLVISGLGAVDIADIQLVMRSAGGTATAMVSATVGDALPSIQQSISVAETEFTTYSLSKGVSLLNGEDLTITVRNSSGTTIHLQSIAIIVE